jgi:DNA-directed RNA polymerase specialized sigma24 family protein
MSTDDGLVGHVPYLRRFARSLTGSQTLGDACVGAPIEGILAGKADNAPARIALYRSVLAEVDALEARPMIAEAPSSQVVDPVQRNLAALTPVGRQAFLLWRWKSSRYRTAALVLEMSPDEVSSPRRCQPGHRLATRHRRGHHRG